MSESNTYPHTFTMTTDDSDTVIRWCKEQGLVIFRDYVRIRTDRLMTIKFKDGNRAMMYKLVHV